MLNEFCVLLIEKMALFKAVKRFLNLALEPQNQAFDEIGEFVIFAKFRLNLVNNIHCFVIVLSNESLIDQPISVLLAVCGGHSLFFFRLDIG